jgi:transcription antitermination factor NusG
MSAETKHMMLVARMRAEADAKLAAGKKAMSEKSRFVAKSVEQYLVGSGAAGDVALEDVDCNWMEGYVKFLQDNGKTENTISNYIRVIQNTCRLAVKAGMTLNLKMFDGFFTGNAKSRKKIVSTTQLRRLANADLSDAPVLSRTRYLFLLCFLSGGARLMDLNDLQCKRSLTSRPECRWLLEQLPDGDPLAFLGNVDPLTRYLHNLSGVAHRVGIDFSLSDDAAAEAWVEAAKQCGISAEVISAVVGREVANLNYVGDADRDEEKISCALHGVADYMGINKTNWYAMNCHDGEPADMANEIHSLPLLKTMGLKHFVPPVAEDKGKSHYMKRLLFVNCMAVDAAYIRRSLLPRIYIFDCMADDGKRIPAPISDAEMKTFMYLSDLSTDDITYYFPDEVSQIPKFEEFEEVEITDGLFAGKVANVYKKSADRLKVLVKFEAMNMYYTVEVPCRFLKVRKSTKTNKKQKI